MIVCLLSLQRTMQSVPITTNIVSSNPARGEVYSKQHYVHYVIKFVINLRQIVGFLRVLWFPPPIKLTVTILLTVALNIITLTYTSYITGKINVNKFYSDIYKE